MSFTRRKYLFLPHGVGFSPALLLGVVFCPTSVFAMNVTDHFREVFQSPVVTFGIAFAVSGLVFGTLGIRRLIRTKTEELRQQNRALEREIRDRKQAEDALAQGEARYRLIAETASDGLWLTRGDDVTAWVNDQLSEMFGYTAEEMTGTRIEQYVHPDEMHDYRRRKSIGWGTGDNSRAVRFERRYIRKDGSILWAEVSTRPLSDEDGAFASVKDITERKLAEAKLNESLERFSRLLKAIPLMVTVTDLDGTVSFVSTEGLHIFGMETERDMVGTNAIEWVTPGDRDRAREGILQILNEKRGQPKTNVYKLFRKNGTVFDGAVRSVALRDSESKVGGMISTIQDVTDSLSLEEGLRRAKEVAETASEAKSEFLANMSHELRTPLNGIMGVLQILESRKLGEEERGLVSVGLESSRSLLALLNDILDLSKVEAGRMELVQRSFSPDELVDTVVAGLSTLAEEKGINLRYETGDLPEHLVGDSGRIRQILFNLVGNAVKFTALGEVTVWAGLLPVAGGQSGNVNFHMEIRDTGIGISDDIMPLIFDSFTQADGSYTRRYQGTGLGLAIVKRIVNLMHGSICVDSEEGRGTTFHVSLKLERGAQEPEQAPVSHTELEGPLSILVAEDDRVNRLAVGGLLKRDGHTVSTVENGAQAILALAQKRYDCVLMDVQMPVMDGISATREIRQGSAGDDVMAVPIIALTAHAMSGDSDVFLSAGMNGYVPKPVELDTLRKALACCCGV